MNLKKPFILTGILLTLNSYALETDNYLAWEVVLPDSREAINEFMTSKIEEALKSANESNRDVSCEAITFKIAKKFRTSPGSKSLETFVAENLDKENIYPNTPKFLELSILAKTRFYLKYSGLSPNLQIDGFYFGADKLSHFASTGRRYIKHYLKKISQGLSEEEAQKSAIRYGLLNEASVLGWWASGVFSYGDMEANYQGFLFYKRMCLDQENTYLSRDENGKWKLVERPDLKDYVSGYWDESFNQSYFSPTSWPEVKKSIQKKYCDMKAASVVADRMNYYAQDDHNSFSLDYIRELQAKGFRNAPVAHLSQSVTEVCEEKTPTNEAFIAISE